MAPEDIVENEIDIREHADRGQEVPPAKVYRVRIDGETVKVETAHPTGELLLSKVHKRPCAFELIAEFVHRENVVIESEEVVDLRQHGLKGFITAHKEIVTIFINDKPYKPYGAKALESSDKAIRDRETTRLYQAEPSGSRPSCTSPYGVVDMIGNVEEWVSTSRAEWAYPSSLKGGYWAKPWSGCRGTNDSHGPLFRFYEVGFRCCSEPETVTPQK